MKKSKYRSVKSGGFDSKREHRRAIILHKMEASGLISDLQFQVKFELCDAVYRNGANGKPVCIYRKMAYIADFVYIENGSQIVEDSKGFRTAIYKKKQRLMEKIHGIKIKET